MQETLFHNWLLKRFSRGTASSRLSNCHRVEEYEGDLDDHFNRDQGKSLIERLSYSIKDQRENRQAKHNIPICGNVYNGTTTLKQAAKLYFEFKGGNLSEDKNKTVRKIIRRTPSSTNPAPKHIIKNEFVSPSARVYVENNSCTPENKIKNFEQEICGILSKLCHHIHPRIIERIQRANDSEYNYFRNLFSDYIKVENYLFKGSACLFPGVRRYVSGKGKKKQYNPDYKAIIDDNTFPRHLWCFLADNKTYNGPSWKDTGLNQFELAHIFTHKKSELTFEKQFFEICDENIRPYGDFTCACNIVLLPKGTVRPTDNSETIKSVFYKRYIDLYGETPLNGRSVFITEKVPEWYKELQWNEPFCPKNWDKKIDSLIEYRTIRITQILNNIS